MSNFKITHIKILKRKNMLLEACEFKCDQVEYVNQIINKNKQSIRVDFWASNLVFFL